MGHGAQDEVRRTVATEPGRLRRGSAVAVLALLSASALAPVAIAVAGGGAVATALVGLAGNVGSGYLTGVIETVADRLRGRSAGPPGTETVRDELAAALVAALQAHDPRGQDLRLELLTLLASVDGLQAAVNEAEEGLRAHLVECFSELVKQQHTAVEALRGIDAEQRRQGRQLRRQTTLLEETVDRLRWSTQGLGEQSANPASPMAARWDVAQPAITSILVPPATAPPTGTDEWHGGAEVVIGDRVYLIHGDLLEERFSTDHLVLFRQARGLCLVPGRAAGGGSVWLRQVEARRGVAAGRMALQALPAERALLAKLGPVRGLPRVSQLVTGDRTATLAVEWPDARSTGSPCECLDAILDRGGAPIDSWRLFRVLDGLAGLCGTLARLHGRQVAHRHLTPAGIIMLDGGRLVLRDLGLAARAYEPGEGPAEYQAPEQRRGGAGRVGARTDVYQLAAVAYHLITGRPPGAGTPLPVRAQVPEVPERVDRALSAALAHDPAARPDIRALGAALRDARDDLSS